MKKILLGIALLFMAGNLMAQEDRLVISYEEGQDVQDVLSLQPGQTIGIIISLDRKTDNLYKGMQFDMFLPKGLKVVEDEFGLYWEPLDDIAATKGRNKLPVWQILSLEEGDTQNDPTVTYTTDKEKGYGHFYRFLLGQTEFYQNNDYYYFPKIGNNIIYIELEATEDFKPNPDLLPIYIRKASFVKESESIKVDKMSHIEYNVGESGFATLCIDDNLDFSNLDIKPFLLTDLKGGFASLTQIEKVAANTPVVIKGTSGHFVLVDLEGDADAVTINLLKGTPDAEFTADANTFAIATKTPGTGFYRCKAGVVIPQYKAYLENATSTNEAFLFEGTTGINKVETTNADTDVYTITGVKVNGAAQKGIYIQNGKKVVVK